MKNFKSHLFTTRVAFFMAILFSLSLTNAFAASSNSSNSSNWWDQAARRLVSTPLNFHSESYDVGRGGTFMISAGVDFVNPSNVTQTVMVRVGKISAAGQIGLKKCTGAEVANEYTCQAVKRCANDHASDKSGFLPPFKGLTGAEPDLCKSDICTRTSNSNCRLSADVGSYVRTATGTINSDAGEAISKDNGLLAKDGFRLQNEDNDIGMVFAELPKAGGTTAVTIDPVQLTQAFYGGDRFRFGVRASDGLEMSEGIEVQPNQIRTVRFVFWCNFGRDGKMNCYYNPPNSTANLHTNSLLNKYDAPHLPLSGCPDETAKIVSSAPCINFEGINANAYFEIRVKESKGALTGAGFMRANISGSAEEDSMGDKMVFNAGKPF